MSSSSADGLPVPATLEQALDPAWLEQALAPLSGGSAILSVEPVETIRTMASKARFTVRFADDPDRVHALCLKAFLGSEAAMGGDTTIREASFYTDVAPHLTMRVPACPVVVLDRARHMGLLVMADLIAEGASFCSAHEPFTAEEAARSLEQIARLHVGSHLLADNPWIPARLATLSTSSSFSPDWVQPLLHDGRGEGLPARTLDADLLFAGIGRLAERFAGRPETMLHGDCHAGNIYRTPDGPGFTDWQLIQRGHWALDVAYHTSAVLPVALAEREERALLDHYLDTVARLGGTPPDASLAWEEYRAAQIYGFFNWAVTRRVEPSIIRVFIERLGGAVTRHDSYALLGL